MSKKALKDVDEKWEKRKKGKMGSYEKSKYDKMMDKLGKHGKEGSKKDKMMDKVASKKMGYK